MQLESVVPVARTPRRRMVTGAFCLLLVLGASGCASETHDVREDLTDLKLSHDGDRFFEEKYGKRSPLRDRDEPD